MASANGITSMNEKTIEYYNINAAEFASGTENADMQECRERFCRYLSPGQKILDAGCGSGRDILAFQKAGYEVDAFDASARLCEIASEKTGIRVRQLRFEEVEGQNQYHGIWACASLLHVAAENFSDVLKRLCRLLKPEGILYASFKYGRGERVKDGRYFLDLDEQECRRKLESAGFEVREIFITNDVRPGRDEEKWVNAIAQRRCPR